MDNFYVSARAMHDIRDLSAVVIRKTDNGSYVMYHPCSLSDYFGEKIGVVEMNHPVELDGGTKVVKFGEYARVACINCSRV